MSGEGNALLLFEYRFNLFIINIFDSTIKFGHDAFDMPVVPGGNIAMKLIILAKHLYFFGVFFLPVLPF